MNIIKYKLDKIRIQIELDETRVKTARANFKCSTCQKIYSDLDMKHVFHTLTCLLCGGYVEEETSSIENKSSSLNKFNTRMSIIFELVEKIEHVRLADNILRPEPVQLDLETMRRSNKFDFRNLGKPVGENSKSNKQLQVKDGLKNIDKWSGDKTRFVNGDCLTRISIEFDWENKALVNHKTKELPAFLLYNRTQEEIETDENSLKSKIIKAIPSHHNIKKCVTNNLDSHILGMLLKYENKVKTDFSQSLPCKSNSNENRYECDIKAKQECKSSCSIEYKPKERINLESRDLAIPQVLINNKFIFLDKITPNHINIMNESEKENYIKICRELYNLIYEI